VSVKAQFIGPWRWLPLISLKNLALAKGRGPTSKRDCPTSAFRPTDDTKAIGVNIKDPRKVVHIRVGLPPEMEAALIEFV
jgi:hypothetical protein